MRSIAPRLARLALSGLLASACLPNAARAQGEQTILLSQSTSGVAGDNHSLAADVTPDGRYVVFYSSADDLVSTDTHKIQDIYLFDRQLGTIELVSLAYDGSVPDSSCYACPNCISADGRYVAFVSYATNLVPTQVLWTPQIYLRDRVAGTTTLVSHTPSGSYGHGAGFYASIGRDGATVAFDSDADDLVANDTNGADDIFTFDVATGAVALASVLSDGTQGKGNSSGPVLSSTGRAVVFWSFSSNFPDANGYRGAYLKDLTTGALERIDKDSTGTILGHDSFPCDVTSDGRYVVFSTDTALDASDVNGDYDCYVRDRALGTTERMSTGYDGDGLPGAPWSSSISDDGRFVAYMSAAADLVPDDTNRLKDVFLRDRLAGVTRRLSLGAGDVQADGQSLSAKIAATSRFVAFTCGATNLVSNDHNIKYDAYLRVLCDVDAAWSNYGTGHAGRDGVPSLTLDHVPWMGSTTSIQIGNSSGLYTVSFLLVGLTPDSIATKLGGTLLVDPIAILPAPLAPTGGALTGAIPIASSTAGLAVYLQALEIDPAATKGVSFTPGLQMVIGL